MNLEIIEKKEKGEGNTDTSPKKKQDLQKCYWFFTLNNYDLEDIERLETILKCECDWYIFQEEQGEMGNIHLQGTIKLKVKQRLTQLKVFNQKIHWETTKCVKSSIAYCTKQETRYGKQYVYNIEVPEEIDIIDKIDFYPWQTTLLDILLTKPHKRNIYWYYGAQGCGKTSFIKYCVVKLGAVLLSGKAADMKNSIIMYKKTKGKLPRIILSNIGFDIDLETISYSGYEDIKDMCFYSGKYEGGSVCGNNPHLVIFANGKPTTRNEKLIVREIVTSYIF